MRDYKSDMRKRIRKPLSGTSNGSSFGPRRATVSFALLSMMATTTVSCDEQSESSEPSHYAPIQINAQNLYANHFALWPNPATIKVCWNNPEAAPEEELQWVKDAVARTWERHSAVDFIGWDACPDKFSGVRITIRDVRPIVHGLGKGVKSLKEGMELNFSFRNWGCTDVGGGQIPCVFPRGFKKWTRQDYIEITAVHEFGHILGFAHEQNRPDTPDSCTAEKNGSPGTRIFGQWDMYSVMNYCNPTWNNGGELSATDIAGLQAFYGDSGAAPTCEDGIRNQDETGVDCGGPCEDNCLNGTEFVIPGRIEAEDCTYAEDTTKGNAGDPNECGIFGDVDIETTADPAGSECNVGFTIAGEVLGYRIVVDETQTFDLTARVASTWPDTSLRIEIDGIDVTGPLVAPANGWQKWEDRVAKNIVIERGIHDVRIVMITDDININYIEFTVAETVIPTCDDGIQNQGEEKIDCGGPCDPCQIGIGVAIPARIEAEDYVSYSDTTQGNQGNAAACGTGGDVDVEYTSDVAGGDCNVGWVDAGEWLEYTIKLCRDQIFDVTARLASRYTGRSIHVEIDGINVTGSMFAPANGWQVYSDVVASNIFIARGSHTVRIYMESEYLNINYLDFTLSKTGRLPTCSDGMQNQGEQGIDCGGPCDVCHSTNDECTCPAGCNALVSATPGFVTDGADNTCYFLKRLAGSYINSWNTNAVNINGVDISNEWIGAESYPAHKDSGYYLYIHTALPWAHVEVGY